MLKYLQPTTNLFSTLVHGELSRKSTLLGSYDFLDAITLRRIRERYTIQELVCLKIESSTHINFEKTLSSGMIGSDYPTFA